jgi:poly-gamma-glutamate biosynthesis protein PgsC/CapC
MALGLVISLILYDVLSIGAGGFVVPGYMAFALHRPQLIVTTVLAGLLAALLLHGIGRYTILYGRRRFVLAILLGLIASFGSVYVISLVSGKTVGMPQFGHIVPGLLATWMDRQGPVVTISGLVIATAATALAVMFLQSCGVSV